MAKNPNYLAAQNMEVTGTEGGLPVIRQLPGEKNSLGKVKFLFPNSFNIYFHDTPSKSLFNKDKRAYSHGCIRLSDPVKMANYLLKDQREWTPEKINEAKGEAFNFGTGEQVQMLDLVQRIIKLSGSDLEPKIMLNTKIAGEIDAQYLSAAKVEERFGWKAEISLNEGLQRTIDWYRANFSILK